MTTFRNVDKNHCEKEYNDTSEIFGFPHGRTPANY